jgi:hypothetical protein
MKRLLPATIIVSILLLSACTASQPSNKEIKAIVYGIYFQDANILSKTRCEMADETDNVWLVEYRLKSSDYPAPLLLTEEDSGNWTLFMGSAIPGQCPE